MLKTYKFIVSVEGIIVKDIQAHNSAEAVDIFYETSLDGERIFDVTVNDVFIEEKIIN